MNAPVGFFDLIGREACASLVSSKQYIVERFLKGVAVDDPTLAEQLREKLVSHRASAVRATREGAAAFREAAKIGVATVGSLCIAAAIFVFGLDARRASSRVQAGRRNETHETSFSA